MPVCLRHKLNETTCKDNWTEKVFSLLDYYIDMKNEYNFYIFIFSLVGNFFRNEFEKKNTQKFVVLLV